MEGRSRVRADTIEPQSFDQRDRSGRITLLGSKRFRVEKGRMQCDKEHRPEKPTGRGRDRWHRVDPSDAALNVAQLTPRDKVLLPARETNFDVGSRFV
jgi:hypothetical protein